LTCRTNAGVLSVFLALHCTDSTDVAKRDRVQCPTPLGQAPGHLHVMRAGVPILVERVDFVLDQAASTVDAKKKRKAEQHHAAASGAKPNAKAAAAPAASIAQPTDNRPSSTASSASGSSATVGTAPAPARPYEAKPAGSGNASTVSAATAAGQGNAPHSGGGRPARLTRNQLMELMPGATLLRTNTAGALRQWVNGRDGTLTVYWAGGGLLRTHSASGKWSVSDDGHFCLQIDWEDKPENWCRYLEPTPKGTYQPIPDIADENWTPPTDQTDWRPFTIHR
jgi:hypothetical protein